MDSNGKSEKRNGILRKERVREKQHNLQTKIKIHKRRKRRNIIKKENKNKTERNI